MNNEGRLFNRDVNVYYFFGEDDRLLGVTVDPYSDAVFNSLVDVRP